MELNNFSFFGSSCRGTDLDYFEFEWFALKTNQDHSVIFETAFKYYILDSFFQQPYFHLILLFSTSVSVSHFFSFE